MDIAELFFENYLRLKNSLNGELTDCFNPADRELIQSSSLKGRAWCCLSMIKHGTRIVVKPLVYLISALVVLILAIRGTATVKTSSRFFALALIAPFTETAKVFRAAAGILLPGLYYSVVPTIKPLENKDVAAITGEAKPAAIAESHAALETTYTSAKNGNLDYSYVNQGFGFGFVIGGAGHNHPKRRALQTPIIEQFVENYHSALKNKATFASLKEAQEFLAGQMHLFAHSFYTHETLKDYCPAIMFTQLMQVGTQQYALMAHMSDTTLYIKTDGVWQTVSPKKDIGFGSHDIEGEINVPPIQVLPLAPGATLVGFTDGIGEFLSKAECYKILDSTWSSSLLEDFKQEIIAKGKVGGGYVDREAANGGKKIKRLDPEQPQFCDDIALYCLKIK